ncbi:MAG: hypothetical protein WCQ96_02990 [Patescibacteria group bacterium]
MRKTIEFCDICYEDDEERRAVARYYGDGDAVYFCCAKCLKTVKSAGLDYEMLNEQNN